VCLLLAALALPVLAVDSVPRYPIEDFLATTAMRGAAFSFDGRRVLVSSDASGVFNIQAIPVDGSPAVPLTESRDDAIGAPAAFPSDDRFLYLQDDGGNELDHLFVQTPDGKSKDLTPGTKLKANFLGWSLDERTFFLSTNERDPRFFDLYEMDAGTYRRRLLFRDDVGYEFGDISRDRRWLALARARSTTDSDVILLDRTNGELRNLTPHAGEMRNTPQAFSPDGRWLYYLTDEGHEFSALARIDLASRRHDVVETLDWDIDFAAFSPRGRYLALGINRDARTEIRIRDFASGAEVPLPRLPAGEITSIAFSRDERSLAFYLNGSRTPSDLFVVTLGGTEARQLTRNLSPRIDPGQLVDAEVVRFRSYDGTEIPGILYRPLGAAPAARVPALVFVHGGPGGQSRVGYSGLIQYLVNHGYAIFAINNRGSSGYGKTFFAMDDRRHGEADLDDCVDGKRMLAGTGWVDPVRIGIMGGSYGGYMVLAALAFRPDAFVAGVDLFGVANWVRTLESIPPYWESFRVALYREMGDPASDGERLRRISPLFHADRIRRPLMVLQGANDPRVLKVESDEMVAAARGAGATVEYVVFDDEGHGFEKKENLLRGYRGILEFLDRHLRGTTP
jgi:dipeptidyl aminopeptidase/acylaminoacyl peptidase